MIYIYLTLFTIYIVYLYNSDNYFGVSPKNKLLDILFRKGLIDLITFGLSFGLFIYNTFFDVEYFLAICWGLMCICKIIDYSLKKIDDV